uniref:Venom protein n=1 Tax=Hemiscolopendra marginata TaxID=943146 RepID=A0A646QE77_9MYRI
MRTELFLVSIFLVLMALPGFSFPKGSLNAEERKAPSITDCKQVCEYDVGRGEPVIYEIKNDICYCGLASSGRYTHIIMDY